jgi:ATP-dependent HslUV protease ATP-binding subunit HslU
MVIVLPASRQDLTEATPPSPEDPLTPREIVAELDRHVVGQSSAKRAVAIALRNRTRRQKLPSEIAAEILPKNILMIGPTGVGKTELARRLAHLARSPFLKVEASRFTEVGYVGRDVDTIVRDLVEVAIAMVRREREAEVESKAERATEERLLDLLLPPPRPPVPETPQASDPQPRLHVTTREKLREQLRSGALDEREIDVDTEDKTTPTFQVLGNQGVEEMGLNLKDMLPGLFAGRKRRRRLPLREARQAVLEDERSRLIDHEQVVRTAIARAEASGIVFLDEIDKIAGREATHGPDVSREGVQRDILPIVEGTTVTTKHGPVKTDHVLFIAAGAFHVSKPTDLIPELQGRFPIRVELAPLVREDFVRILTEPRNALLHQYRALLGTDGIDLQFTADAISELARFAAEVNTATEDIGARRLATILETVLEEISFEGADPGPRTVTIDGVEVRRRLEPLVRDQDLRRFIL